MRVSLDQNSYLKIRQIVSKAYFKVAITGAGISKASGLPLLNERIDGIPLNAFFDGSLFHTDAEIFYESYRKVLRMFIAAKPNPAHFALAKSDTWVITQNIDGLHRLAGSKHILEMHGNVRELNCPMCNLVESSERALEYGVPKCPNCNSILHPGIVLAGEQVRHVSLATDWVGRAEVLFIVGTKLTASPVAELPKAVDAFVPIVQVNHNAEALLPKLL